MKTAVAIVAVVFMVPFFVAGFILSLAASGFALGVVGQYAVSDWVGT